MSAIKKTHTPWNKGKKMTEEYKETVRNILTGKKGKDSRNWKGGIGTLFIRKQRMEKNGGSHTKTEWESLKGLYKNTCPCCLRKEPEIKLSKDHIVPVAIGGSDSIDNIQPLCISCNAKKHTQNIKYEFNY
jgi:5-methylcytosine-specific restriction endonuclease McrA